MGGDDSQKLLPWRGIHSSPGRKPPAQLRINNVTETAGWNLARGIPSFWPRPQLQTAWATFGEQRRVNSAARRRKLEAYGRMYAVTKAIRLQLINPALVGSPYQKR